MCRDCSPVVPSQGPVVFDFIPPPPVSYPQYSPPAYTCFANTSVGKQWIPPPPIPPPDATAPAAPRAAVKAAPSKKSKPTKNLEPAYLKSKKETTIHVIPATKVWEDKYGEDFKFKIVKAPTCMIINEAIELLTKKEGDANKGFVLTEVFEKGDGLFVKAGTVEYGSDRGGGTLASMGWNEKRGAEGGREPVWVVLWKKDT